jgi:hypothetical protein
MFPGRHHLAGLFGLVVLALLAGASLYDTSPLPPAAGRPRLAVLVVFDQMRGDYLDRWASLFEEGGFRRLCSQGTWFQNCHYPYSGTQTGPGHASLAAGCSPDRHGIVANEWYDGQAGQEVYCVGSDRARPVPALPTPPGKKRKGASSPERLLAQTLADSLKEATSGKARVVALSLKDRSAVLPGGKYPDACYWLDDNTGQFITSTYYRGWPHSWVSAFNKAGVIDRWLGRSWDRLHPDLDYEPWSGPDDVPGEGGRAFTRTFPHRLEAIKGEKQAYYNALITSPFGNDLLLELTRRAIAAEKLGQHSTPDLLCVSFSSNDLVGHVWGPDSQEVLDVTLRSDRIVRDLLGILDDAVGKDRYVLALSADHGICPLPEVSRASGREAARIDPGPIVLGAREFLDGRFPAGSAAGSTTAHGLIAKVSGANIYLDHRQIQRRGVKLEEVEDALAGWLPTQPGVARAYAAHQLREGLPASDAIGQKVRKSFRPERSGDVILVEKPYYLLTTALTGTNHGTPHEYDTHVPLVIYGSGVQAGVRHDLVTPQAAAVILAHALDVPRPAQAEAELPAGVLR